MIDDGAVRGNHALQKRKANGKECLDSTKRLYLCIFADCDLFPPPMTAKEEQKLLDEIEQKLIEAEPIRWYHPGPIDTCSMKFECCGLSVMDAMDKGCTPHRPLVTQERRTHPGDVNDCGRWTCCNQPVYSKGCKTRQEKKDGIGSKK